MLATNVQGQYKKEYSEKIDTFENGAVKSITQKWIKTFEKPPMHEYYTKTTTVITEFFDDGSKKLEEKSVQLIATFGPPCTEVEYSKKSWYKSGKKKYFEKRKCDKHLSIIKEYNKKGQLILKKKTKHNWRKEDS